MSLRNSLRRFRRDTRGVSLAIIAMMMTALLSLLALSLDLGLLYTARAEAQRAADAAALAGASAFLNPGADAEQRARRYATLNDIRGVPVDADEVTVAVFGVDSVSVRVRRESVPLWFARLFGFTASPVAASATAGTVPANSANCVAPLLFQHDAVWQNGSYWESLDGKLVTIAPQGTPAEYEYLFADETVVPSSWTAEPDECSSDRLSIGQNVAIGDPPFTNDWARRLAEDPTTWDDIESGRGWSSPRIITVMLHQVDELNPSLVTIRDFLLFYVESADVDNQTVYGRFLAYASGTGQGPSETMLALQLTN